MKKFKSRTTINSKEYKILTNSKVIEKYYGEGWSIHRKRKNSFSGSKSSWKLLYSYQVRLFRSWKHNRKTQWK